MKSKSKIVYGDKLSVYNSKLIQNSNNNKYMSFGLYMEGSLTGGNILWEYH